MLQFKRVLILAPHTDDGEMGCGGTIAKLTSSKTEITYVAFSFADKSLPTGFPPGTLKKELINATRMLGIPEKNVVCYDYEVRRLSGRRQEVLEDMFRLRQDIDPDLVLAPSLNDIHQDHTTIAEECRRMFKKTTILGYEMPWNNMSFDTQAFSVLEEEHVERKAAALECYSSQKHRRYLNRDFIIGLARTRGIQIDVPYAEAFELVRWIIK